MSGPLSNADLAPVPADQRTWSRWNIAALWIGMAVCIPTYMLAAGMIAVGMTWWQAVLTVLLGNLIVLIPMIANGHGGTKYGVPFPVLARASFGTVGAHIPAIARAVVACGWFGIQTWIGGAAIYSIFGAVGWISPATEADILPFLGISIGQFLCFLAFWLLHVLIVLAGIESIKWVEAYAAPFLIACGVALLVWAFVTVDDTAALFASSAGRGDGESFWTIFFPQLTAMVGFWATLSLNIPDFTRYCRSQRDQATGQLMGLPSTMTLFSFVGIVVTGATMVLYGEAIWDPVELVSRMGSPLVVVLSMIALLIATLSTNLAANVVSPANGFSNLSPSRIGFRGGALITAAIGVLIMPWRLMTDLSDYIFVWLIGYSALLGPIAGIMLCDYFIVRRTTLNAEALYDPEGEYAGVSAAAILALVLAVLPNLPGFVNAVTGTAGSEAAFFGAFFDQIYGYAWFIGLPLAMILYWLFKQMPITGGSAK
ncbi:MAG: NCS1 family nucleobase:cation symporter-1 [Phycisphaerales bacterium]|jgi:NCS1 family nucleobase:cation symporter-1|nr:NCS1 family nucleobase:cation symporter-1 [Phycisphaerales bacterium]